MHILRSAWALLLLGVAAMAGAAEPPETFWYGRDADGGPTVVLHYFYSPSCPHCQVAGPYLDALDGELPWLELRKYSVRDSRDNARLYLDTAASLGVEVQSVPGFIFCRQLRVGFDSEETTGAELREALEACYRAATGGPVAAGPSSRIELPLLGVVDPADLSLPVLTAVLAGVDAFNPCAFFVLLFLLSLMVHAKSRARMLIVGGTFVLFSGLVYFVFMAAWLNLFLLAGELRAVTLAAGLVALVIGAINVKDYFWFRQGVSLSIPDAAKPGLFRRMREVVAAGATGPMLAGTILLAIVANSYELLCTAGLPMVYTRTLTLAGLPTWQYYAYLAAYNVIYVIPLLVIVVVFAWTLGARKLSESEGRLLKLVSGCMMLAFGILLLAAPHWLTVPAASVGIVALAVVIALVTHALGQRLQRGKPRPR
jgi:thiol-disulfide isomerase/thioredoxin